jgi:hypothetical protein
MINQTKAVDKVRLIKRLGRIPVFIMPKVDKALLLY